MRDYYVIHVGRGTDGGFGDYSPPRWSANPVQIDGRTIWFALESEASSAVERLNEAASEAFPYVQYSGDFPAEYEYRKITAPAGPSCDEEQAIALVTAAHGAEWPMTFWDILDMDEVE